MDTINKYLPSILSALSVFFAGAMATPLGAIVGGVGILLLVGGAAWVYSKYKNFLFAQADKAGNQGAVTDHGTVISGNQSQAADDGKTISQSEKDKQDAKTNG